VGRTRSGKPDEPKEKPQPAQPAAAADLRGLCVVLFGMPAAGKSSLLGALLQAAQSQPGLLGGELKDQSGGLESLQRRLYQDRAQETLEEIVPFAVTFQPLNGKPIHATLVDCDGRIAYAYLTKQRPLGAKSGQLDLAAAVEEADSLLLVVDVSAQPDQLKRDFTQFSQFLRLLEEHRGREAEVAGLPVYLVLTKCDLLARPSDTSSQWLQRIEDAKRKISQRFKEFLAAEARTEKAPFGQIDLHVWATAVKRPTLADKPARPTEPFGVAELFRQCFASGLTFTQTQKTAERRLQFALIGIVGLLALLLTFGGIFFLSRPSSEVTALENQARTVLPPESAATKERLRGSLDDRIKQLDEVLKHREFAKLPEILQDRVHTIHHELKTYRELSLRLKEAGPSLADVNDEETLLALNKALKALEIPDIYQEEWKATDLSQSLEQRREQAGLFRLRLAETEGLVRKRISAGERLYADRPTTLKDANILTWLPMVRDYLKETLPPAATAVPGLPEISYRRIYEFKSIEALLATQRMVEDQLQGAQRRVLDLLK